MDLQSLKMWALRNKGLLIGGFSFLLLLVVTSNYAATNTEQVINESVAVVPEDVPSPTPLTETDRAAELLNQSKLVLDRQQEALMQTLNEQATKAMVARAQDWRDRANALAKENGITTEAALTSLYSTQLQKLQTFINANGPNVFPWEIHQELQAIDYANNEKLVLSDIGELPAQRGNPPATTFVYTALQEFQNQWTVTMANEEAFRQIQINNINSDLMEGSNENPQ